MEEIVWILVVVGIIVVVGIGGAWICWFTRGPYVRLCSELAQCGNVSFCGVGPDSQEYREDGMRMFVVLPWPDVQDEKLTALVNTIYACTREFADKRGMKFRATQPAFYAGGACAIMIGLVKDGGPVDT